MTNWSRIHQVSCEAKLLLLLEAFSNHCIFFLAAQTNGESVISSLFTPRALDFLSESVCAACFNEKSIELSPSHVLAVSCLTNLQRDNLGANGCTSLPSSSSGGSDNVLPWLTRSSGTPQGLLEAYARGEAPSAVCGGGAYFLAGHLPIAWLVKVQTRHLAFQRLALSRHAVWPGYEAVAACCLPRLPVSPDYLALMDTCTRLSLNSNNDRISKILIVLLTFWAANRVPGVSWLLCVLLVTVALIPIERGNSIGA